MKKLCIILLLYSGSLFGMQQSSLKIGGYVQPTLYDYPKAHLLKMLSLIETDWIGIDPKKEMTKQEEALAEKIKKLRDAIQVTRPRVQESVLKKDYEALANIAAMLQEDLEGFETPQPFQEPTDFSNLIVSMTEAVKEKKMQQKQSNLAVQLQKPEEDLKERVENLVLGKIGEEDPTSSSSGLTFQQKAFGSALVAVAVAVGAYALWEELLSPLQKRWIQGKVKAAGIKRQLSEDEKALLSLAFFSRKITPLDKWYFAKEVQKLKLGEAFPDENPELWKVVTDLFYYGAPTAKRQKTLKNLFLDALKRKQVEKVLESKKVARGSGSSLRKKQKRVA